MHPLKLGDIQIDRVVELDRWVFPAKKLFPNITTDILAACQEWLDERFVDFNNAQLILGVHSFLIRAPKKTILVDTCNGNHRHRPSIRTRHQLNTRYYTNLLDTGVRPEDIDIVLTTHLHPDHCGWNTRLVNHEWVPTFPKAKYLINKVELEEIESFVVARRKKGEVNDITEMYNDSVLPIITSGQLQLFDTRQNTRCCLCQDVHVESTPGHSTGHVAIRVNGGGRKAVITGDAIHHPIQFNALNLANASDSNPLLATETRTRLIRECIDTNTIILGTHFAGPTACTISSTSSQLKFNWLTE